MFGISITLIVNLALTIVFCIMSVEDWRSMSISGLQCFVSWVLLGSYTLLFGELLPVCVIIVVIGIFFYAVKADCFITSADVIPLVAYLAVYWASGFDVVRSLLFPLSLLAILFPYGKVYAKSHGFEWHIGDRVPMPMLPCFASAWMCALIANIILYFMRGIPL